jgi:hypothetical protein
MRSDSPTLDKMSVLSKVAAEERGNVGVSNLY